jgi:leucyl aminopeptidase (aminopeptidase T)
MNLQKDKLHEITGHVVRDCLGVKSGESFLILVDSRTSPELGRGLFENAVELGAEPLLAELKPRQRSGEEPSKVAAEAMKSADVVIACASTSLYHTEAKGAAQAANVRGLFNAPSDASYWVAGAMTANFPELRRDAERLRDALTGGSEVHVTSPAGTDVTMSIKGREPKGWLTGICLEPGQVSALPGGEVSLPPLEGTSEGTVVVERVVTDLGGIAEPITWTVREGNVVEIDGGEDAKRLEAHIEGIENATNIGELGIGINPHAILCDDILESKKQLGTAHIAMGDSAGGYGGLVVSDIHLDGMVLDVRIELDGRVLVENGNLQLD